jgi:peptide chain release factor 2
MTDIEEKIKELKNHINNIKTKINLEDKQIQLKELEEKSSYRDFWDIPEKAKEQLKEISRLKEEINFWNEVEKELQEIEQIYYSLSNDEKISQELLNQLLKLEEKINEKELEFFLSGSYDKNEAVMILTAGQGGRDAEDFCRMLFRMYCKYFEKKRWPYKIVHQHFSEEGGGSKESGGEIGLKNITLEIDAPYTYGFLKNETGVHRLVRISPFDAKKIRHTSFVLVEVLPQIEDINLENIELKDEDLKIEFARSSGPGGQNVNKRETSVRIVHLPTGISASCQSERSQLQNKQKALYFLKLKIFNYFSQQKDAEKRNLRKKIEPSWGNQVRNYVLHPYKLVKDLRTNIETNQIEEVFDGNIDMFIKAELLQK